MMRLAVIGLPDVLSGGCGSVNDYLPGKDNSEPPAAQPYFTATRKLPTPWSTPVGCVSVAG